MLLLAYTLECFGTSNQKHRLYLTVCAFCEQPSLAIIYAPYIFQSTEFLVFGLAMFADMIFFAVLAYFYTPSSALSEMASQEGEMYEVSKEELSA